MAKPIRITVRGNDNHGDDAPTVQDLLCQIQDQVDLMRGVEAAIATDGREELDWRVTNVTKNSPITFELTPSAKTYGTNIDNRASQVVVSVAKGLASLGSSDKRPPFFTDAVIKKLKRVVERVTNGLAATEIDFSGYGELPYSLDADSARLTSSRISKIIEPSGKPHKELGSIEGFVKTVGRDGYGRPLIQLNTRLDGTDVKCTSTDGGLDKIGHLEVKKVIRGLRVKVYGILYYKNAFTLDRIDVERVELFEKGGSLPTIDDILEPNFTDGVEAVEYLKQLRADG